MNATPPGQPLLLGIDVGTSSLKAVVCDGRGTIIGSGISRYQACHPGPQQVEQDPTDWWEALKEAIAQAIQSSGYSGKRIEALAMSTQGGTLVPVDKHGASTTPAVIWTDTRCAEEAKSLRAQLRPETLYERTGWPLGSGLNLLQILWIARHRADVAKTTSSYLSVHDYLSWRLTGRAVLDPSNAGVNQLASVHSGQWDPHLLSLAGIRPEQLGEIMPAGEEIGRLLPAVAEELDLSSRASLINGGHDQYCLALGLGVDAPGEVFVGAGTAWVAAGVEESAEQGLERHRCVSRHVVPGLYGSLLSLEAGGASLEWWRRLISVQGSPPTWEELESRLPDSPAGLPLFLPHLLGSPYPRNLPQARGVLTGLEIGHDAYHVGAAVMMGVAQQMAWMLEDFPLGSPAVTFAGGAAQSRTWVQYLANATGRSIRATAGKSIGAKGAALLAGRALGVEDLAFHKDFVTVYPDAELDSWREMSDRFRALSSPQISYHN